MRSCHYVSFYPTANLLINIDILKKDTSIKPTVYGLVG
jgi:hypothetical protein